jgi:hypothetical protein
MMREHVDRPVRHHVHNRHPHLGFAEPQAFEPESHELVAAR